MASGSADRAGHGDRAGHSDRRRRARAGRGLALAALLLAVLVPVAALDLLSPAAAQQPPAQAAQQPPTARPPGQPVPLPQWERALYGTLDGESVLLHNGSIVYGKLALGDLDGDGDADLLVGRQDGRIDRFENTGGAGTPVWRLVQEDLTALRPRSGAEEGTTMVPIDTNGYAAPALVDIDQDGDLDLFIGTGDGRLLFFRNVGNRVLPAFALVTDRFLAGGFGTHLVPVFADVDRNRAPDLLIGNAAGEVYLLVNQGTQRRASFCVEFPARTALPGEPPPCLPVPQRLLSVSPEQNAAPGLVDWDGDGDLDLFVGKSNGSIAYFRNRGSASEPDWRVEQERFLAIDDGGYAAPAFLDVNGDGKPDILIGSSTNRVAVYTNKDTGNVLDVWKQTDNVLSVRRPGTSLRQIVLAPGDLDGDGDVDLLVGDRGGRLLWLENVGDAKVAAWRTRQEHLLAGTVRENLSPWLVDLDKDGDLDLLLGGADGRLWLMRNVGTAKEPQFVLESTNYAGIDVGDDSVPVTVDLDGDGDPDLLVGSRRGTVLFYRNEGSATQPEFRLAATSFAGVNVGAGATPAILDANGDGRPDLVVGSRRGGLLLVENGNERGSAEQVTWRALTDALSAIRTAGSSAPRFADLNGDGRPDLLIGDADGNLRLWLNRAPPTLSAEGAPVATQPGGAPAGSASPAATAPIAAVPATPNFQSLSGLVSTGEGVAPASAAGEAVAVQPRLGPLEPVFTLATDALGDLRFKGRIRPAFGDLNGDGLPDLVVGTADGRLAHYRNTGTAKEPRWTVVADNLPGVEPGGSLSPLIVDLDGDGLPDIVVGTEAGRLLFFRNTGSHQEPAFTRMDDVLTGLSVGRNAAPAAGYVDAGETLDLIVGDLSGQLWTFVRDGGAQSLNFHLADRRFLNVDVGVASTPFVGDIDRDGIPDLLVGSDQGRVSLFTLGARGWVPGPDYFKGLKFPFGTSPRLVDVDGDGDLDLVTGSEKGTLYLFRNDAVNPDSGPHN